ncbi:MAG: hypothetical protein GY790_05375 [Bacteroidetes bacterium]|nr:hypothetical protein [Bacteroidota bacterium]
MDFDVGNIIYVLITLVAIIASLLGKKKKPGAKESKPGFFENLEKVLKMGQEDPVVTNLREYEPDLAVESDEAEPGIVPEVSMMSEPSLLEEYESLLKSRGGSLLEVMEYGEESSTEPMNVIQLDEEEGADYFEIVKDFDAGTAVVYSAIINRIDF